MGHYGCRGIAAAIADPPHPPIDAANGAVQNWVEPIREIFRTSTRWAIMLITAQFERLFLWTHNRPEIVAFRNNTSNFDPNNPDINNRKSLLRSSTELLLMINEWMIPSAGYRALVEENVKASVRHIAKNPIITNVRTSVVPPAILIFYWPFPQKFALLNTTGTGGSGATVQPVFIHGWVYDLVTGDIRDLGISVGPPSSWSDFC